MAPCSSISFRLAGDQGAALLTKHLTHREDIRRERTFEKYAKEHYDSWVTFARETGHGNDIKPILVTGVDMTRDFAMVAYSNSDCDGLTAEFTTSAPDAPAWGTWQTTGVAHTNCGPQPCRVLSPTRAGCSIPSADNHPENVSDEHDQCVFIRYYTMRKRLGIPRVIKAAAGPHDPGSGDYDDEPPPLMAQYDSDLGSDIVSSPFDDSENGDSSSVTSIDSESDIVIHNTTPVRFLPYLSAPFVRSD